MIDDAARASLECILKAFRESIEPSVEALKQDPRMAEIIDTHEAINTLEIVWGLPKTSLDQVFGLK